MLAICAACTHGGRSPRLPPASAIFLDPLDPPTPRENEDARLFSRRALDYGDGNADRLEQSRRNYEAFRRAAMSPDGSP